MSELDKTIEELEMEVAAELEEADKMPQQRVPPNRLNGKSRG